MRVIAAGHICADLIPELPPGTGIVPGQLSEVGPLTIEAGGSVSNTGRVLAALGHDVVASATLGEDDLAAILRERIAAAGLDTGGLTSSPLATSYSVVVQPLGQNRSFWHHPGANAAYDGAGAPGGADVLHLGYPPMLDALIADGGARLTALLARAQEDGTLTSIDMAVVDPRSPAARLDWHGLFSAFLPLTDVFSPSIDDVTSTLQSREVATRADAEELAGELIGLGAGIVMLSAGEDGLALRAAPEERLAAGSARLASLAPQWADARVWAPAQPVDRLRTTNGAGDAATAALLHALGSAMPPAQAAEFVTRVAACHIQGGDISALAG